MSETKKFDEDAILDQLWEWHEEGDGFNTIKDKLRDQGFEEGTIAYLIRKLDEYIMADAEWSQKLRVYKWRLAAGVGLFLVGGVPLFLDYLNPFLPSNLRLPFLGPLVIGFIMAYKSYKSIQSGGPLISEYNLRFKKRL